MVAQRMTELFLYCAGDLRQHIREEFEKAAGAQDAYGMKHSLSDGRVQLKYLSETLGMTSV